MRKCIVCDKNLGGYKKRFCGDVCYKKHKQKRDKIRRDMNRTWLPETECVICGEKFQPIRDDNESCSRACSVINAKNKQQIKRKKQKKFERVSPMDKRGPVIAPRDFSKFKRVNTATFNPNDTTKEAVLEYLKKGNTILKFPDEPRSKIPSVHIRFGTTIEERMGFGFEYENEEQDNFNQLTNDA